MSDIVAGAPAKIGNAFTKKLGPLPGWAWMLLVVSGAYGLYYYRKSRGQGATAVDEEVVPDLGTPADYSDLPKNVTPDPTSPMASTNAQWARTVADQMNATGRYSPSAVANAISHYLNGETLNATEKAIINTILATYGTPPEGVIPVLSVPVPGITKPSPYAVISPRTSNTTRSYTVVPGDSLISIATRYYGVADWQKIYAANRDKISDPNVIHSGQVLIIPA